MFGRMGINRRARQGPQKGVPYAETVRLHRMLGICLCSPPAAVEKLEKSDRAKSDCFVARDVRDVCAEAVATAAVFKDEL